MRSERAVANVSELPTVVFGSRGLVWWGTVSFMVIEGFTMALTAMTYLYLRKNFDSWPPHRTPRPSLLVPTINMAIMLASLPLAWWTKQAAERIDLAKVRIGLLASTLVSVVVLGLRIAEFWSLETQWNSDAYGSIIWVILGFHATILLVDVFETAGFTAIMYSPNREPKHWPEVADNAGYWFFAVLSWVPLYLLVFIGPRVM
ncbi:MAG TPA: cytochrome c oxidase subunit 3 [Gemmatimonadaceae bacterium]|nr:cytochrome c oxidase subunit 3 [Gemmatimonadaceae bacterium]